MTQIENQMPKKVQLPVWAIYLSLFFTLCFVVYAADLLNKLATYSNHITLLSERIETLETSFLKMEVEAKNDASFDDLFTLQNRLNNSIDTLQKSVSGLHNQTAPSFAVLDCTQQAFAPLTLVTPQMIVFAICGDAQEYLEGYKISLRIGNPHYVNFTNVSGTLSYFASEGNETNQMGSVDFKINEPLVAGSWQLVTVIIPKATKEQVRNLALTLQSSTVLLSDTRR